MPPDLGIIKTIRRLEARSPCRPHRPYRAHHSLEHPRRGQQLAVNFVKPPATNLCI
jgi:hypothetical protein